MEGLEVVIKAYEQALHKVDVLGRNYDSESVCAEDEYKHGGDSTAKYRLRIINRRILHIPHMYARHLHTCIEEENRRSQHYVVEI